MTFKENVKTFLSKVKFREYLKCAKGVIVSPNCEFEGANKLGKNSELYHCCMGYASYIAPDSTLYYVKIGKYCSIGKEMHCIYGKHPTDIFVSTHPAFYDDKNAPISYCKTKQYDDSFPQIEDKYSIVIGNDVWIGDRVSIMEGVRIGDGAIIAAGAVVVKDVEPYTIVGGVPAKIIRKRFNEDQVAMLQKHQWWDKPKEWIEEHAEYLTNIDMYIRYCEKEGKI